MDTCMTQLRFTSKVCKIGLDHAQCSGVWRGLGFEVICECQCHLESEKEMRGIRADIHADLDIAISRDDSHRRQKRAGILGHIATRRLVLQ